MWQTWQRADHNPWLSPAAQAAHGAPAEYALSEFEQVYPPLVPDLGRAATESEADNAAFYELVRRIRTPPQKVKKQYPDAHPLSPFHGMY